MNLWVKFFFFSFSMNISRVCEGEFGEMGKGMVVEERERGRGGWRKLNTFYSLLLHCPAFSVVAD